ncbi:hypothetical protein M514_00411 [Trichuris suis]|uniref:Uncharacterized protein n=1 Tax=Trichuris suis TaxID=68888 RepID=A0A085NRA4_9BILA|nr:hypothetical protein M513_00411 [Trichuris suis]KFD72000.1 hypothetical protein M514_00411 [Trichuris suis]
MNHFKQYHRRYLQSWLAVVKRSMNGALYHWSRCSNPGCTATSVRLCEQPAFGITCSHRAGIWPVHRPSNICGPKAKERKHVH